MRNFYTDIPNILFSAYPIRKEAIEAAPPVATSQSPDFHQTEDVNRAY